MSDKKITGLIIVKNARLSFNQLFTPQTIGDSKDPKFNCTVICEEGTQLAVEVADADGNTKKITKPHSFMKTVCDEVFKNKFGKLDAVYSNWAYNKADGSGTRKKFVDKKTGEYRPGTDAETFLIDASIKEEQCEGGKIKVLDNNKAEMQKNDKRIYSGCYVNLLIEVYGFDNQKSGKGVSASLGGVQWKGHGERFVGKVADAADEFDEEEIDEEEDGDEEDWG